MKTTIDVDREDAGRAAEILGTGTLEETVNAALREVVAAPRRKTLAERARVGALHAPTPAELARLRAPRLPVGALSRSAGSSR